MDKSTIIVEVYHFSYNLFHMKLQVIIFIWNVKENYWYVDKISGNSYARVMRCVLTS